MKGLMSPSMINVMSGTSKDFESILILFAVFIIATIIIISIYKIAKFIKTKVFKIN